MRDKPPPQFLEGLKLQHPVAVDIQEHPPVPCDFKVGDIVVFTNEFGVSFRDLVVTGFTPTVERGDSFIYLDKSSWWFAIAPKSLHKDALTQNAIW